MTNTSITNQIININNKTITTTIYNIHVEGGVLHGNYTYKGRQMDAYKTNRGWDDATFTTLLEMDAIS